eukprot:3750378-Pleurochrysis_carterae.AAC.1
MSGAYAKARRQSCVPDATCTICLSLRVFFSAAAARYIFYFYDVPVSSSICRARKPLQRSARLLDTFHALVT